MKIAFVYDAIYPFVLGGAERRVYELSRRMAPNHDVHLVGWSYAENDARIRKDVTLHGIGKPPRLYDAHGRRRISEALSFSLHLIPFLRRHQFDVIDCSSIPYTSILACSAAGRSGRTVVTWHEFMGSRWKEYLPPMAKPLAAFEHACAMMDNHRIAVSAFTASRLPSGPPTEIVPNGINSQLISEAYETADGPSLLFVGRLLPHKRVDLAIRALACLEASTTLTIVGSGPQEQSLRQLVEELGLNARVTFLTGLPDHTLYGLMKSARALILPSEQEGQSIVVREALACGLPAIVTDSPYSAASESIRDEVDGFIVEPNPEAIAAAYVNLASSQAYWAELSHNAIERRAEFDWSASVRQAEAFYSQALAA